MRGGSRSLVLSGRAVRLAGCSQKGGLAGIRNSRRPAHVRAGDFRVPPNQFGGAIGAPIIKSKLFVFGDYQGFGQSTPVGVDFASVPTTLTHQGNFSELLNAAASGLSQPYVIRSVSTGAPFPGNIIPSNLQNPVGLNYLNAYPMPNIAGKVQQNYVIQRQQTQNFDDFDVRGDWNATQSDRLFARASYAHDKEDTSTRLPGLPAGFGFRIAVHLRPWRRAGLHAHLRCPTLFSDLRLGFPAHQSGLPPALFRRAAFQEHGYP